MPQPLIYALYRLALAAGYPALLCYFLLRGLRDRRYFQHWRERWGTLPRPYQRTVQRSIWLHAVSVGEVLSSAGLLKALREAYPDAPLFLSCMTVTGRAVAEERLSGLVDGIFYLPWDYAGLVRRVLRHIRPAVVVVLETEIWPNLYREVKRSGAGLVIVNGRISVKAFPTYLRWRWLIRAVLQWPDAILGQSERDREHYLALGAPAEHVRNIGNLKYDFASPAAPPEALRPWLSRPGPLWIAASTTGPMRDGEVDEDEVVLNAYEALRDEFPGLRLLLAPRKPERFETVAALLQSRGIDSVRRSQLNPSSAAPVLLLDTLGELNTLFASAAVVFVGGSLVSRGGHNILEPAISGAPIIVGPRMENFQEIFDRFLKADALRLATPDNLRDGVADLLRNGQSLGQRGRRAALTERGATVRAVEKIGGALRHVIPRRVYHPGLRWLTPLWRWGAGLARRRAQPVRLRVPVISVGNLTTGGTGKTPLVKWLIDWAVDAGYRPGVLTRGYGRRDTKDLILAAGAAASVEETGDEAQTLLRHGRTALGIGADRVRTGTALAPQVDLLILDDGFQHARLERDLDIVVLDGTDPFGGLALLPAGRLREPIDALARAHLIVVSRAPSWSLDGVEQLIRQHNELAPIQYVRAVPERWTIDPVGQTVAAFCGLGNPEAFWATLRELDVQPVWQRTFPDHYRYTAGDLEDLSRQAQAAGATLLLTTEKDAVKLEDLPVRIPVSVLPIGLDWPARKEVETWLRSHVQAAFLSIHR